jgi:hypothetical protein
VKSLTILIFLFICGLLFCGCDEFRTGDDDPPLDGYYWAPDSSQYYNNIYGKLPENYEISFKLGDYVKKITSDSAFYFIDSIITDNKMYDLNIFVKRQTSNPEWGFRIIVFSVKETNRYWEANISLAKNESSASRITDKIQLIKGKTVIIIALRRSSG